MIVSALKLDPSRTGMLRRSLIAELARRYSQLSRALGAAVRDGSLFQSFTDPATKLRVFKAWLDALLNRTFPELRQSEEWPKQIGDAYVKGLVRSFREVRPRQVRLNQFLSQIGGQDGTLIAHAARKVPQYRGEAGRFVTERVHLMAERFKSELSGATAQFAQRAARVVSTALDRDYKLSTLARMLERELEISKNAATRIARTEIVKDQADGQLDGIEELGHTHVSPMAEWVVGAGACPLCSLHAGQVFTIEEARNKIPLHPNCGCAWTVATGKVLSRRGRS